MSAAVERARGPKTGGKTWGQIFWRHLSIACWFSYDKMQAMSAIFTLAPAIKANARNKQEIINACKTNVQFFNTQPFMANFVYGICWARIENHEPEEAIQAVKVGLMGPFAGIGDSLLWFTVRPICFSIGAGLALQGNIMGPIFALAAFWLVGQYVVRHLGFRLGYEQGTRFIEDFAESGLMEEITNTISIVGITVVGTLISSWVRLSTPLVVKAGEGAGMRVQPMLDMLLPKLLPALATALAFYMLTKRKIHPIAVILIFLCMGVFGSYFGLF